MTQQSDIYRSLRRAYPRLPARFAWEWAADQVALERRVRNTGFQWLGRGDQRFTLWHESGYALHAAIEIDDTGWDLYGAHEIGRFQSSWAPGAIRHPRFNRSVEWFVPTLPHRDRDCYRRACAFRWQWHYVSVAVTATRSGVDLGYAILCGLDSDGPEDDFTAMAFYLADEAIRQADLKLTELAAGG